MKIKKYWPEYRDYRTDKQWAELGFTLKPDATGVELWSNQYCQHSYRYYSPDEVMKVTENS